MLSFNCIKSHFILNMIAPMAFNSITYKFHIIFFKNWVNDCIRKKKTSCILISHSILKSDFFFPFFSLHVSIAAITIYIILAYPKDHENRFKGHSSIIHSLINASQVLQGKINHVLIKGCIFFLTYNCGS